ncbi:hypothetical protein [Rhizobium binae]|uniref:hypothetical protein n=1 Tax=Rhizobium binae TaxID=1138190 RepID=UPI003DA98FA5
MNLLFAARGRSAIGGDVVTGGFVGVRPMVVQKLGGAGLRFSLRAMRGVAQAVSAYMKTLM